MRTSRISKVPFHKLINGTLSSGVFPVTVNPATLGTRLGVIADGFEEYRITRLKFRLHPGGTAAKGADAQVAAFYPGVIDTTAGTVTDVSEVVNSTVMGSRATTPSAWCTVDRATLSGPFSWYKSLASTLDTSEENQGQITVAGNVTDTFQLELAGAIEFKGSSATANTPMALEAIRQRQRERLLSVLAGVPSAPTSKGQPKQAG